VEKLHAGPGDTILVGHPLISIARAGATPAEGRADGHGPVLVGYGTDGPSEAYSRRRRGAPVPVSPGVEEGGGRASPLVRKMALERGIDLGTIKGTGPGGRIRVEDLEATQKPETAPGGGAPVAAAEDEERISTVGLRKAIAARMLRSATTIPHFTEYSLFDASALVALRSRLREEAEFADLKLTYVPFFVRALVKAVQAYPIMNSRWDEEGNAIVIKRSIHVGIATDTARGLLVPVLPNAQTLSLSEIAALSARLIEQARGGTIEARSLMNGTITITNVGAAGPVDTGAPLINPPEACVVGFGAIKPRPTVVGDTVQVRPGAWISISGDHRIVDGATAAQFMGILVDQLEDPSGLV
jgi:pyruvate/2-oxoglutarate dehydrogenase complex dihydrolipoamide acyltransferase (E2) component